MALTRSRCFTEQLRESWSNTRCCTRTHKPSSLHAAIQLYSVDSVNLTQQKRRRSITLKYTTYRDWIGVYARNRLYESRPFFYEPDPLNVLSLMAQKQLGKGLFWAVIVLRRASQMQISIFCACEVSFHHFHVHF